jgi:hypothetical protein
MPYGENRIFYGGNHIALWRKLHLAMAKIILGWRKLFGRRSPMAAADALWQRLLFSLGILLHSA